MHMKGTWLLLIRLKRCVGGSAKRDVNAPCARNYVDKDNAAAQEFKAERDCSIFNFSVADVSHQKTAAESNW